MLYAAPGLRAATNLDHIRIRDVFKYSNAQKCADKCIFWQKFSLTEVTSKNQHVRPIIDPEKAQGSNSLQFPNIHLQYSQWRASEVTGRKTNLI